MAFQNILGHLKASYWHSGLFWTSNVNQFQRVANLRDQIHLPSIKTTSFCFIAVTKTFQCSPLLWKKPVEWFFCYTNIEHAFGEKETLFFLVTSLHSLPYWRYTKKKELSWKEGRKLLRSTELPWTVCKNIYNFAHESRGNNRKLSCWHDSTLMREKEKPTLSTGMGGRGTEFCFVMCTHSRTLCIGASSSCYLYFNTTIGRLMRAFLRDRI